MNNTVYIVIIDIGGIIMLDSIKKKIEEVTEEPFSQYYQQYIFKVQDQNLDREVNTVKAKGVLSIDKLINELHRQFKL